MIVTVAAHYCLVALSLDVAKRVLPATVVIYGPVLSSHSQNPEEYSEIVAGFQASTINYATVFAVAE